MNRAIGALILLAAPLQAQVVYVNDDAAGAGNGTSWQDAYTDIQVALNNTSGFQQVWVAEGLYIPSQSGDRTASIEIPAGLEVYGGFAGTESSLVNRAGLFATTYLSGDLAGNDGPNFVGRADNSLHVVTFAGFASVILDGFTIRGGNANGDTNWDSWGGALVLGAFGPPYCRIRNCLFIENEARQYGGAVYFGWVPASLEYCDFRRNRSGSLGGAVCADNESGSSLLDVVNCSFQQNSTRDYGGALYVSHGSVVNCVFTGNSVTGAGSAGGAAGTGYMTTFTNCTVFGNRATSAGGVAGGIMGGHGSTRIFNSILWGNLDSTGDGQGAQANKFDWSYEILLNDSCIENWDAQGGSEWNLNANPRFEDPEGPDGELGTADDDLSLARLSPCVDAAHHSYAGPALDLGDNPRMVDSLTCDGAAVLDLGAFERQVIDGTTNYCQATPSSLGSPVILSASCAPSHAANDFSITATPLPSGFAMVLFGQTVNQVPLGDGVLCVGGALHRTTLLPSAGGPTVFPIDLTQGPPQVIHPASVWSFQVIYRDLGTATGTGVNLSDALRCTFRP
jgi:predicted outer membrane repeat protein